MSLRSRIRKGLWVVGVGFLFLSAILSDYTTGFNATLVPPFVAFLISVVLIIYAFTS